MLRGENIPKLITLFKRRGVLLYHACQLLDFQSYLKGGGIPSRAYLEKSALPFTGFVSDANDRSNDLWNKVFVNLQDFGEIFADGRKGTPNPYGPILVKICPEGLIEATDIAVTLRSAGAQGFNREQESLNTVEEVERVFFNSYGSAVKFKNNLLDAFPSKKVKSVEINCSFPNGLINSKYIRGIIVDPYTIRNETLLSHVQRLKNRFDLQVPVFERRAFRNIGRKQMYSDLCDIFCHFIEKLNYTPTLQDIIFPNDFVVGEDMREWAKNMVLLELEFQFDRYSSYLCKGTLRPIMASKNQSA